jgi:type II secretory pathway component PulF
MGLFVTRLARPPVYVFFYEALDTSGEEASGVVEATGEEDACEQIKRMGLFITKITRSQEAKSEGSGVSWWGRLWGKRSRR